MHHIYHTDAFILGSRPAGEDSRMITLYTKELGLVRAHAQGVRKLASKLRYVLQDFSHVHIDLVRGKEIWRVTTALPHINTRHLSIEAETIMARIASLVVRLVTGEEASEDIFSALSRAYDLLGSKTHTPEEYRMLELLSVARILVALGYLPRTILSSSHDESEIPDALKDVSYQHALIRDINMALSASQL